MLKTPILFLIFNRPDTTERIFEAIRRAQPQKLYIAADGPRAHKPGEHELCEQARAIVQNIDWPCEVHHLFSETNKGCKRNVSGAITWFFENVEEGIILEDDCLPDPSFFPYCEELLARYRNTPEIKIISGDNFQFGKSYGDGGYYFSRFAHIWGWATWRRTWKEYDVDMKSFPEFKASGAIQKIFSNTSLQSYWMRYFEVLHADKIDTWDGQLTYAIYRHNGIAIIPNTNLITNIGFGGNATHTRNAEDALSNLPTTHIGPLTHPTEITVANDADMRY